jgi:diguanylate cyclase (GGDEF)-like protein
MNGNHIAPEKSVWKRLKRHFVEAFSGELLSPKKIEHASSPNDWGDKRRRNAYRYILLFIAAILTPLVAYNFYTDEYLLLGGTVSLLLLTLASATALSVKRTAALPPHLLLLISIALLIFAIHQGQHFAMFLLFPMLVGLPILMRLRWALSLAALSGASVTPHILLQYDPFTAVMIGISLVLTWIISAWLVFAMNEQSRRLKAIAITDPLTGAYNRRYLELQADRSLQAWKRYRTPVSLLLIDIDHFKRINDKFGHAVGDTALQEVVKQIAERIRKTDIQCRFGGEEFVVLLNETNATRAEKVADELRYAIEQSDALPEGKMTVSVGVCSVSIAKSVEQWFKLADNALYLAKRKGRNRVAIACDEQAKIVPISKSVPDWR